MTNPRRDVDIPLDAATIPRDWCADDPYDTTMMNALSLLFPEGERFFVDSVKQHRDLVTDRALAEAVAGFIGQEAMHGREHRSFNELLVEHGFAAAPKVDAWLRRFLGTVRRVLSPKSQLAVTCALEHFTAMLAEQLLSNQRMREQIHPSIRPLWMWHALEESEHKAVAFDVYRAAGGGYMRRAGMMLVTSTVFFAVVGVTHARLMSARGILFRPWKWLRGIGRLYVWPAYFLRLVPAYLSYFRPRFHPSDRDNQALVETWRERLFGDGGELRERVAA
ncbi:MAG TPA: metal-dependent hydrolase [Kofleriaceae bacterium]|nr:metal-dependent hydrolase [Kofleriaceae bacterium]